MLIIFKTDELSLGEGVLEQASPEVTTEVVHR